MAENGIPSHLVESADKKIPTVYYHNWLYSVVPVGKLEQVWHTGAIDGYKPEYPLAAALSGYCRNCNQAFSIFLNTTDTPILQDVAIPKDGCVGPNS